MIHDTMDNIVQYEPLLDCFEQIQLILGSDLETGTYTFGDIAVEIETYIPGSFSGAFKAHESAATLVVMLEGCELFGQTYSERCKGTVKNDAGWFFIQDSPITTVTTARPGMFTLFMPREPYALGIAADESPSVVKRMILLLQG